ncbi:MAG: thioredoxin domain-containing protein, partial [Dongiaceae bacterium]
IKVDREERPDLDAIYQSALALLGQPGGWPLTMFLTPDGRPFWGGTYFPPSPRYGRPGFLEVLDKLAEIYRDEPEKIAKNVAALREALENLARPQTGSGVPVEVNTRTAERLLAEIDPEHGGIGGAPKFPHVPAFELLWRAWKRTGNRQLYDAVTLTLTRISQGGIYDHLGGGYARYSTDAMWLAPHFEKMLYDNAQLITLLSLVWPETREKLFADRVHETVGWVLREMRGVPGSGGHRGFASSLDADSEHEEGKFYVWREAEVDRLLDNDAAVFKTIYDVTAEGNWEGHTILNRIAHPAYGAPSEEAALAANRAKLFAARESRVRPGWDDKVLADWNGLM